MPQIPKPDDEEKRRREEEYIRRASAEIDANAAAERQRNAERLATAKRLESFNPPVLGPRPSIPVMGYDMGGGTAERRTVPDINDPIRDAPEVGTSVWTSDLTRPAAPEGGGALGMGSGGPFQGVPGAQVEEAPRKLNADNVTEIKDWFAAQEAARKAARDAARLLEGGNPDEAAKALELSQRTGATRLEVQNDIPTYSRLDRLQALQDLQSDAPQLHKWMEDNENFDVAHDDTDSLQWWEQAGTPTFEEFGAAVKVGTVDRTREQFFGAVEMGTGIARMFEWLPGVKGLLDAGDAEARKQRIMAGMQAIADQPEGDTWFERGLYSAGQSAPSTAVSALISIATKSPMTGPAALGVMTGGGAYGEAEDAGKPFADRLRYAITQGGIETGTELVPMKFLLGDLAKDSPFAKVFFRQVVSEGISEQAATFLQDASTWLELNPEKTIGEFFAERPNAALETAVASTLMSGVQASVGKGADVAVQAVDGAARQKRAEDIANMIRAMGDKAADSKLLKRMPDKYREAVAAVTKDGPLENIRVDGEAFRELAQEKSLTVERLAQAFRIDAAEALTAIEAGQDVVIPSGNYAAVIQTAKKDIGIGGAELHTALAPNIRLRADDFTAKEVEAMKQVAADEQAARQAAEGSASFADAADRVREDSRQRLAATGRFNAETTAIQSSIPAEFIITLAERTGQDPEALWTEFAARTESKLQTEEGELAQGERTAIEVDDATVQRASQELSEYAFAIWKAAALEGRTNQQIADDPAIAELRARVPEDERDTMPARESVGIILSRARNKGFPVSEAKRGPQSNKDTLRKLIKQGLSTKEIHTRLGLPAEKRASLNVQVSKIKKEMREEAGSLAQEQRGGFTGMNLSQEAVIRLYESANLSTFVHETAHWYLTTLEKMGRMPDAHPFVIEQLAAIRNWAGKHPEFQIYDETGQITPEGVEVQEMFAETFEAYLRNGKAPSTAMRSVFAAFKSWLMRVYKQLTDIGGRVRLDAEITAVFDRALATDEAITAARKGMDKNATQMAQAMLDKGVITQKQFERTKARLLEAKEKAEADLMARLMEQYERNQKTWWNEEERDTRREVQSEVDERWEQRAYSMLAGVGWRDTRADQAEAALTEAEAMNALAQNDFRMVLDIDTRDVKHAPDSVKVIKNPTKSDLARLSVLPAEDRAAMGQRTTPLRYVHSENGDLYAWRGDIAIHDDIISKLGIQVDRNTPRGGGGMIEMKKGEPYFDGQRIDMDDEDAGAQGELGQERSLPMDEASRMQRAREMGFDTERVAYRGINRAYDESGKGGGRRYQMFTSSESDAAEYGSTVVAAYLRKGNNLQLDGGGRNFNSVSVSQLPDDVRAKLHPSIQGAARIDDIADAAQKAGYDSVTVANVYDNAWGEIPTKPRAITQRDIDRDNELLRELGIDPGDVPSTPRAPEAPAKNTDPVTIDVVFDTKNIRSKDAAFDPSQEGSSKLLAQTDNSRQLDAMGFYSAAQEAATRVPDNIWKLGWQAARNALAKGQDGIVPRKTEIEFLGLDGMFGDTKLRGEELKAAVLEHIAAKRLSLVENFIRSDPKESFTAKLTPSGRSWNIYDASGKLQGIVKKVAGETEADVLSRSVGVGLAVQPRGSAALVRGPGDIRLPGEDVPLFEAVIGLPEGVPGSDYQAPRSHVGGKAKGTLVTAHGEERVDDKGQRTVFVGQVQSDMAQQAREEKEARQGELERVKSYRIEELHDGQLYMVNDAGVALYGPYENSQDGEGALAQRIKQAEYNQSKFNAPLLSTSEWTNVAVRSMIYRAAREGFQSISFPTAETSEIIQGNDDAAQHYETNVKGALEKIGKQLGGEVRQGAVKYNPLSQNEWENLPPETAEKALASLWARLPPGVRGALRKDLPKMRKTDDGEFYVATAYRAGADDSHVSESHFAHTMQREARNNPLIAAYQIWVQGAMIFGQPGAFERLITAAGGPNGAVADALQQAIAEGEPASAYILDITPAMRAKIVTEGFPLFQTKTSKGRTAPPPGLSPMRLDLRAVKEQYGPEALAALPPKVRAYSAQATDADQFVELARDIVQTLKKKPPRSLWKFLSTKRQIGEGDSKISYSGIRDPDGEILAMIGKRNEARGLIATDKDGAKSRSYSYEEAAHAAWEEGYFNGESPPEMAEFLDALRADFDGTAKLYRSMDQGVVQQIDNANDWANWFDQNDIDINEENDAVLRATIETKLSSQTENAIGPDEAAPFFKMPDGRALLEGLKQGPQRDKLIREETRRRMIARHGDIFNDGTMMQEAEAFARNEVQQRQYEIELEALSNASGKQAAANLARETARELLRDKQVREVLNYNQWLILEQRWGKKALEAAEKGDFAKAAEFKRYQAINAAMFREGRKLAETKIEPTRKHLLDYGSKTKRARLLSAGQEYLEQMTGLLDDYQFRPESKKGENKRQARGAWIRAQMASIDPYAAYQDNTKTAAEQQVEAAEALERSQMLAGLAEGTEAKNFKSITVDELLSVRDEADMIWRLATLKDRLIKEGERRRLSLAADDIAAEIIANQPNAKPPEPIETDAPGYKVKRSVLKYFAMHRTLQSLARQFAGDKDNGVFWRYIVKPLNEAFARLSSIRKEMGTDVDKLFSAYTKDEQRRMFRDRQTFDFRQSGGPRITLSKQGRLAFALNWGNAKNRQRLMDSLGLEPAHVQQVLNTLDKRDWDFVQASWDYLDTWFPEANRVHEAVHGAPMDKEAPLEIATQFGIYRGGYYPLKFDPMLSSKTGQRKMEADAKTFTGQVGARNQPGFSKSRVKGKVTLPLRLSVLDVITSHLDQVAVSIATEEAMFDAGRLIKQPAVENAIISQHGREVYNTIVNTLVTAKFGLEGASGILAHLRNGATVVGLGWKVSTALLQPLGISNSIVRVGGFWIAKGYARMGKDAATIQSSANWIMERSEFMRNRRQSNSPEMQALRGKLKAGVTDIRIPGVVMTKTAIDAVKNSAFAMMANTQFYSVDMPTWYGAYFKAKAAGMADGDAYAEADQAVIDSQGGGELHQTSAMQTGAGTRYAAALRLLTNFMSYMIVTYNLSVQRIRSARTVGQIAALGFDMAIMLAVPVAGKMMIDAWTKGGGDDDDELFEKYMREQAAFLFSPFVGISQVAGVTRGEDAFGYRGPAGLGIFGEVTNAGKAAAELDFDASFWRPANKAAGMIFHYPASQIDASVRGAMAYFNGETDNPAAFLVGPPPAN